MTGDKWVEVDVDFGTAPPTCDQIDVSEAKDKGIKWVADRSGFSFTGVVVKEPDGTTASGPGKEFYNIKTGSEKNSSDVSVGYMTVKDKNEDKHEHTYVVSYTDSSGKAGTFDPGIQNED